MITRQQIVEILKRQFGTCGYEQTEMINDLCENIADQIVDLISQDREELAEKIEKMPKFDLSKNGVDKEFYLKREEVLSLIKKRQ